MGAALFDDSRWHVLMGVGDERLSDYPNGCPTEEGAQFACYTGIRIYLSIEGVDVPSFEAIQWNKEDDPSQWVDAFYRRPLWEPHRPPFDLRRW